MIVKDKIHISQISWLSQSYKEIEESDSGIIDIFYEPESLDELADLCRELFSQNKDFLVIGHTSNLYFSPDCHINIVVSTRKCTRHSIEYDHIYCECGVSVMKLSRIMCDEGICGFDGLIDLPGTVASSIYGNSSAFGCSINSLLIECDILLTDGSIKKFTPKDLELSTRSSILKSGEIKGVILSAIIRKTAGDRIILCKKAKNNRRMRNEALPGPAHNLGSVFKFSDRRTLLGFAVKSLTKFYSIILKMEHLNQEEIRRKKLLFSMTLIGARELKPYVYGWNLYMWTDSNAHRLFPVFIKKHNLLFKNDSLEIEIIR